WQWRTVFLAPDDYAWSIVTAAGTDHYLFDGRVTRAFIGGRQGSADAGESAPPRGHGRLPPATRPGTRLAGRSPLAPPPPTPPPLRAASRDGAAARCRHRSVRHSAGRRGALPARLRRPDAPGVGHRTDRHTPGRPRRGDGTLRRLPPRGRSLAAVPDDVRDRRQTAGGRAYPPPLSQPARSRSGGFREPGSAARLRRAVSPPHRSWEQPRRGAEAETGSARACASPFSPTLATLGAGVALHGDHDDHGENEQKDRRPDEHHVPREATTVPG